MYYKKRRILARNIEEKEIQLFDEINRERTGMSKKRKDEQ